jgi:hypothetical protein
MEAFSATGFELDAVATTGGVAVAGKGGLMNPAAESATTAAAITETKPPRAVIQPGAVVQKEPFFSS